MSTLAEAYEALDNGKIIKHIHDGEMEEAVVYLEGQLRWKDEGTRVCIRDFTLNDWTIEEPEMESDYVDCPIEWRNGLAQFSYQGKKSRLDIAPRFKLIGYVYKDGEVTNLLVRYFEPGRRMYHCYWKEGYKAVRPIAVRFER